MRVNTTRFGEIDCLPEDQLEFKEGLLGFLQLRHFVILDDPNDEIFAWLQSCEAPEIAFPVLEPEIFASETPLQIPRSDYEALALKSTEGSKIFCIVTIPVDPTQMTANMKAPILINTKDRIARQCVLQDNNLAIREPIFVKLQQRVMENPTARIKPEVQDVGAVKLIRPAPEAEL
jgi:flagellar assembly factor FliW